MSLSNSEIIAALSVILGEAGLVADPADMGSYLNEPRKRFKLPAVAVAIPGSVAELQAICRWANEHRVGLIPQGGNTGLVGAQVPAKLVLRRVEQVDPLVARSHARERIAALGWTESRGNPSVARLRTDA